MSDKVRSFRQSTKPRNGFLAKFARNLPPPKRDAVFDPFIKPRLGRIPASFHQEEKFYNGNGMAVSSGAGRKWRGNAPLPLRTAARERGEGRKEHDIAAFIKLNVSFPDRAFPGEGTLFSDQLPPPFLSSFLPSFFRGNADRVGSPLPSHTILFPPLNLRPLNSFSLNCIFVYNKITRNNP